MYNDVSLIFLSNPYSQLFICNKFRTCFFPWIFTRSDQFSWINDVLKVYRVKESYETYEDLLIWWFKDSFWNLAFCKLMLVLVYCSFIYQTRLLARVFKRLFMPAYPNFNCSFVKISFRLIIHIKQVKYVLLPYPIIHIKQPSIAFTVYL